MFSLFKRAIKYVQEKEKGKIDCKKGTFFYLNFSSIATLKNKDNDFLCQLLFLELISILVNGMCDHEL